jgi:flavin reductase (DIM6/NTAB) family NADH-FMN oxidoreductase RutF
VRSLASPSVLARTKEIPRGLPTGIWVVTANAADGTKCGITAYSVATCATTPDVLTFNVLRSSAFFASFCGVASHVRVFLLSAMQVNLADEYVTTLEVSVQNFDALSDDATLAIDVVAEQIENVLDHLLVVCRVQHVLARADGCRGCESPLLRVDRGYTKLGHTGTDVLPAAVEYINSSGDRMPFIHSEEERLEATGENLCGTSSHLTYLV